MLFSTASPTESVAKPITASRIPERVSCNLRQSVCVFRPVVADRHNSCLGKPISFWASLAQSHAAIGGNLRKIIRFPIYSPFIERHCSRIVDMPNWN
jgi:hypothetical protein